MLNTTKNIIYGCLLRRFRDTKETFRCYYITIFRELRTSEDLRIAEEDLKNKKSKAAQAKAEFYAMIDEVAITNK